MKPLPPLHSCAGWIEHNSHRTHAVDALNILFVFPYVIAWILYLYYIYIISILANRLIYINMGLNIKHLIITFITLLVVSFSAAAARTVELNNGSVKYVFETGKSNDFPIVSKSGVADIIVSDDDWPGVHRVVDDLSADICRVTGKTPAVKRSSVPSKGAVIVGTLGHSSLIDSYVASKKIDVSSIKGQWEAYIIQTVGNNLLIVGSDRRGTIFGVYDLSEQIGVSPWYWWADVPAEQHATLFVAKGRYHQASPAVKYRGIFINDEEPSFGGWCKNKFSEGPEDTGVNSKMYAHMFELILRLKANYLWPAMWGKCFNEDDPMSPVVADYYGVVMGTSHHEPMMRSQTEYTKRQKEVGPWDYTVNADNLNKFWREGIHRNRNYDNVISIGMRGDGDVAMGTGDDMENIKVLESVIEAQRKIIKEEYGKEPSEVPQIWALFTEVQRYYDAGMKVPDDVTLLFCDNNWGYIRRIGPEAEKKRSGGMGLYYHIDMNGGPWNDRFVNSTTVPKLREQLGLAYDSGIDRLWIINVGDLKPKEYPIDFIMRFAWNPDKYGPESCDGYTKAWARQNFGGELADEIADVVSKYSKYVLMRKPEVNQPGIFSVMNYQESELMIKKWNDLEKATDRILDKLPKRYYDAFFQLVEYPVKASSIAAKIYLMSGINQVYAQQGRLSAKDYANEVLRLYEYDIELEEKYNKVIAGGKWDGIMRNIHLGYTQWSMPQANTLPQLLVPVAQPYPSMGIAVEGVESTTPGGRGAMRLPAFDCVSDHHYFDLFNRGIGELNVNMRTAQPWIILSESSVSFTDEKRIEVSVDWDKMADGRNTGSIMIAGPAGRTNLMVTAVKSEAPVNEYAILAKDYSSKRDAADAHITFLPDLGRGEGCMGVYPRLPKDYDFNTAPVLTYKAALKEGANKICLGLKPLQDVHPERGLYIAISIDNGKPVILDGRKGLVDTFSEYTPDNLAHSKVLKPLPKVENYPLISRDNNRRNEVFDDMKWLDAEFETSAGIHELNIFFIHPEFVLEEIVVNPDRKSYLGPQPVVF